MISDWRLPPSRPISPQIPPPPLIIPPRLLRPPLLPPPRFRLWVHLSCVLLCLMIIRLFLSCVPPRPDCSMSASLFCCVLHQVRVVANFDARLDETDPAWQCATQTPLHCWRQHRPVAALRRRFCSRWCWSIANCYFCHYVFGGRVARLSVLVSFSCLAKHSLGATELVSFSCLATRLIALTCIGSPTLSFNILPVEGSPIAR